MKPRIFYRLTWLQHGYSGIHPFSKDFTTRFGARINAWSLRHTPGAECIKVTKMKHANT